MSFSAFSVCLRAFLTKDICETYFLAKNLSRGKFLGTASWNVDDYIFCSPRSVFVVQKHNSKIAFSSMAVLSKALTICGVRSNYIYSRFT